MRQGFRVGSDLVRYHQIGVASGWVEVEGARTEISPDTWVSTRDHSWGVRYDVGLPPRDLEPRDPLAGLSFRMIWSPSPCSVPTAPATACSSTTRSCTGRASPTSRWSWAGSSIPTGRWSASSTSSPQLAFDPVNRRLRGGTIEARGADGTAAHPRGRGRVRHRLSTSVPGLYFGLDGHHHGEWRGDLAVEGEHVPDCADPAAARRLHQIRDTVVHVVDPVGGGEGWGNCQPIITGGDDALGLSADDSFM